ncbi:MAG: hypothetical protein JWQ40_2510 [Segetibacter sp.]|nr:hypothetical protein [Segetibacter sp.]
MLIAYIVSIQILKDLLLLQQKYEGEKVKISIGVIRSNDFGQV